MDTTPSAAPSGYHTITPYLAVERAAEAIEFYTSVFGASERMRMTAPDGRIGHAELTIGDAVLMLSDECPELGHKGPRTIGASPVTIHLYVTDVDATAERALAAGATLIRPVENQFYGDRTGTIADPFGHTWHLATHVEDVPPDELEKRAEAAMRGHAGA